MLNSSKLIGFAATTKPKLAKKFYKETLGLALVDDNPFALVFDANGIMLRIQKVEDHSPAGYTVLGWEVADIARTTKELVKKGVRFERYDGMTHDPMGIWTSPAGAKVVWFNDPDGNILSLTQF